MKPISILPLLVAASALFLAGCSKSMDGRDKNEEKVPVEVATVLLGSIVQSVSYDGDIRAETEVHVFSKVPDRIEAITVTEGTVVRKGDPIARVVATSIEQAVRQAEAALSAARAQEANVKIECERAERLLRERAMSQQQFDAIKTQLEAATAQREQAEAMLATARTQLADATVTAPIDGIVAQRNVDPGDVASPNRPLVTIVRMDRVRVVFDVTETDFGKVRVGQEVLVNLRTYPGREFRGRVTVVSPVLDPQTRMARVEAVIENRDRSLRHGMFGRVEVITGKIDSVIVIPRHAVIEATSMQYRAGQEQVIKEYFVYIVDGERAQQRKLEPVYINHKSVAVAGGIQVGEQIVTLGQNALRDGAAVLVVREEGEVQ